MPQIRHKNVQPSQNGGCLYVVTMLGIYGLTPFSDLLGGLVFS